MSESPGDATSTAPPAEACAQCSKVLTPDDRVATDPLGWDFLQGGDRAYRLDWDPVAAAWSIHSLDGSGPSAARAVLAGNTILWLVPAAEVGSETPLFRVGALVHDGTLEPEGSGGDVSGLEPTMPLTSVIDLR